MLPVEPRRQRVADTKCVRAQEQEALHGALKSMNSNVIVRISHIRPPLMFALVFVVNGAHAQSGGAKPTGSCAAEIPTGVKVIRFPTRNKKKSPCRISVCRPAKDPETYDLSMQIKNATDNWCITSLAVTYIFGDARGQEWTANEYPAVTQFKTASKSRKRRRRRNPLPNLPGTLACRPARTNGAFWQMSTITSSRAPQDTSMASISSPLK